MNSEILTIKEKAAFDYSITYAEKRTHQPNSSNSYNNNDEIRIPIPQQNTYTYPYASYLYMEGEVSVYDEDNKKIENADVKFVNNGPLLLFDDIRLEINAVPIDRVRNPGLASIMKGYATYNENRSLCLQNAGWFPKTDSTLINQATGRFNCMIPLKMVLGFFEDFRKIVINMRQELILLRSSTDLNAFIYSDTTKTVKVKLNKLFWKMPHISVSDAERLKLIDTVTNERELDIPFRSRELHEYSLLPLTQRHSWPIKTSIERPQFLFFGFQTDRKNKLDKNYSHFDHCNLTNIKVFLNDEMYPYDSLNLNFDYNQIALLYEMFAAFQESFLEKDESEPMFTPQEFKEIAPIAVIDLTKQQEMLKRSPVDIRIEFETSKNIPQNTTAYTLILNDRIAKYIPLQNVIRV